MESFSPRVLSEGKTETGFGMELANKAGVGEEGEEDTARVGCAQQEEELRQANHDEFMYILIHNYNHTCSRSGRRHRRRAKGLRKDELFEG